MNISILLFEEVDILDAGGPYEVFLTAARLVVRDSGVSPFTVTTFTIDNEPVTSYGGMGLIPNGKIEDLMQSDVLIVPGTIDIDKVVANKALVGKIAEFSDNEQSEQVVASVCTGAFLLAEAGLLDNCKWITHGEDIDLLAAKLSDDGAMRNVRWVDNGRVVTAAGLSSGIDMALHLVERFASLELATRTAKQIEHTWVNNGA